MDKWLHSIVPHNLTSSHGHSASLSPIRLCLTESPWLLQSAALNLRDSASPSFFFDHHLPHSVLPSSIIFFLYSSPLTAHLSPVFATGHHWWRLTIIFFLHPATTSLNLCQSVVLLRSSSSSVLLSGLSPFISPLNIYPVTSHLPSSLIFFLKNYLLNSQGVRKQGWRIKFSTKIWDGNGEQGGTPYPASNR